MMLNTNRFLVALIVGFAISPLVQAQLKTFKPGDVIKSSEINENFEYLEEQIGSAGDAASAQCSATQDGSNVVISCTDGSSAVLAGAGTVVAYPEGGIYGESPTKTWSTGAIIFQDANGVNLAEVTTVLGTSTAYIEGFQGTFYNNSDTQSVILTGWGGGIDAFYLNEDCSGQAFLPYNTDDFHEVNGNLLVRDMSFPPETILFSSKRRSGQANFGADYYAPAGACQTGQFTENSRPAISYTPADEIVYAAYPVSIVQLP
jgi:hypothetical protein